MEALSDIQKSGTSAFSAGGSVSATQVILDFGAEPVSSKRFSFTLTGATVGQKVLMTPAADTDDDELEMDNFACAARVSATNTIVAYIAAVPGPVIGQRRFNVILG